MEENLRTGQVAIIGKPNVGKSTLINTLLGQKIAAVSTRPQTTRRRQLGILSTGEAQIIFVDTPGIHNPRHKLGQFLNQEAMEALQKVDAVLWLVDASRDIDEQDLQIASTLNSLKRKPFLLIGLNKMDLVDQGVLEKQQTALKKAVPNASLAMISASKDLGLDKIISELVSHFPMRLPEFPTDQITDLYEREIAANLIREAALLHLRDEVPHSLEVRVDEYKERSENNAYVQATLFVEKASQKGIIIGAGGQMLKKIGTSTRREIEKMSGRKIYLELRVKVEKNWRNDDHALRRFGYRIKKY